MKCTRRPKNENICTYFIANIIIAFAIPTFRILKQEFET